MPFNFASNSDSGFYNNILSIDEQGGKIDFTSAQFYSKSNSVKNSGSLVLHDYSGLPVKAIQFDIKLLNTEGKIKINSIEAGEDIPHDQFLMDYQIYPGIPESDGSSVDIIKVVILGNGDNVLINKNSFDLVKIIYDVKEIDKRCVELAFDTSAKLKTDCLAYDMVFDQMNNPKILEISFGFLPDAYSKCEGYWDRNLAFHKGVFNPYAWMIERILYY